MPFKLTIEMNNITEPGSSRSEVFCKPTNLSKKRLWQRRFPVYFAKFLRTPFLQNISGGFFWKLHIYSYLLILTQPAFICSNSKMKTAENLVRSSNRRSSLRAATLLKKRLWHRCFPVNFAKFLRIPFLQNTSGRLLLSSKICWTVTIKMIKTMSMTSFGCLYC